MVPVFDVKCADKFSIYEIFLLLFLHFKLGVYFFRCVSNDKRGRSDLPQVQAAYKSRQS